MQGEAVGRARELTLRGIALGIVLTIVFTAANVYLGLKIGLTFASSIPAAVISMAALRALGGGAILENNIVQTVASAAGTLASVIFVVPGLVMVGHWRGIPYFETAGICLAGSVLGVLFTIPLRRVLVVESGLPFPEGVAAATVLRLGQESAGGGARALGAAGIVSAVVSLMTGGFGVLADGASRTLVAGGAVFRLATGFSLALLAAGYLMGVAAGVAVLVGLVVAWGVAVPVLTALAPARGLAPDALALSVWTHQVKFIGAGTIGIAAVATLVRLAPAIGRGVTASFQAARRRAGPALLATERDLGGAAIGAFGLGALVLLAACFLAFLPAHPALALFGAGFAAAFGFLVAAACGYMSGIVGASASPISGIAVVAVVSVSLVLLAIPAAGGGVAVPLALFATAAVIAIATISNDNLQDLKTGQLVGATPGAQQIALIIGGLAGAAVIPPILELLYQAYGFSGAMPRPGMDPAHALAAPQAALMAAIAQGIAGHSLDWTMIGIGVALGAVLVTIDVVLRARTSTLSLPVLGTGIGIYLPPSVSVTLVVGAAVALAAGRSWRRGGAAAREAAASHATLVASGLIVGESLVGVVIAAVIGGTGRQDAMALVGPGFASAATVLGLVVFVALALTFWRIAAGRRLEAG